MEYKTRSCQFSPDIAVVTNLFEEHMDYHGDAPRYYNAKKNIINFQKESDTFVYNQKNKIVKGWLKDAKAKVGEFSKLKFSSKLLGLHNQDNIGAALSVAKKFGVSNKTIQSALYKFRPLPHRLEFVGYYQGIYFYDDAISTTPQSTILAIESLKNVDTIFLGGQDRGYTFSNLEKTIKKYKISNVVLFPESGDKIKIKGAKILRTSSMKDAVLFAHKNTKRGKICLLSCASPSYSLWKNFEQKGEEFQKYIKLIAKT